jgi:hypothetical protein
LEQQLRAINIAGSTNMLHSSDKTEETFFPSAMLNTIFCVYGLAIFQSATISSEEQHNNNNNIVCMKDSIILNAVEQLRMRKIINEQRIKCCIASWLMATREKSE